MPQLINRHLHASMDSIPVPTPVSFPYSTDILLYRFTFISAGKLYMFATDKDESLMKYEVNPQTFALVGSPENIFSVDDDVVEYRSVYSKDSAFFYILCRHHKKKGTCNHFSGIVFDPAFSIVNKYEF